MVVNPFEWKEYVLNLDESNIQPSSIDFTIERLYISTDQVPEFLVSSKNVESLTEMLEFQRKPVKLLPRNYYVGISQEKFKALPLKWSALVIPKSSTFGFGGLNVIGGWIDPGFDSYLRFGIQVLNPHGVIVEKGTSLLQVIAFENNFIANSYNGRWVDKKLSL
ncbi:MAG: hypothetical protein ACFFD4_28530 [Candidatus Odinarchaeota archaeon]